MQLPLEKIIRYESEDGIHVKAMDMGELVRCRDCRHYRTNNTTGYPHCEILKRFVTEDWFCADGERKG